MESTFTETSAPISCRTGRGLKEYAGDDRIREMKKDRAFKNNTIM
jgi:hypothetical protein